MCQDFEILLGILSFLLVREDTHTCEDFKVLFGEEDIRYCYGKKVTPFSGNAPICR